MNKGIFALVLTVALVLSTSCSKFKSQKPEYSNYNITVVPPEVHILPVTNEVTYQPVTGQPLEIIELTSSNTVVMDQAFDDETVSTVMFELQKISTLVPKNSTVYLVLNSPGGSVTAGLRLITFIKGLPLNVKTISLFSASMAFQTVQNLGERLVLPDSTLMSHRAKFGVRGEAPGEMFSQLKFIMTVIDSLDYTAAQRMNLSFDEYRKLVADEYWSWGANIVNENAADRVVLAKCHASLMTTKSTTVNTLFGPVTVEVSNCPLIPGILSVEGEETKKNHQAVDYAKMLFNDKRQFVEKYILTGKIQ